MNQTSSSENATASDDTNIRRNSDAASLRLAAIEKMGPKDKLAVAETFGVAWIHGHAETAPEPKKAIDFHQTTITRDARTGAPWTHDNDREGKFCVEDIKIEVDIREFERAKFDDEGDLVVLGEARIIDDVPIEEGGFLFKAGQKIQLSKEEADRIELEYAHSRSEA